MRLGTFVSWVQAKAVPGPCPAPVTSKRHRSSNLGVRRLPLRQRNHATAPPRCRPRLLVEPPITLVEQREAREAAQSRLKNYVQDWLPTSKRIPKKKQNFFCSGPRPVRRPRGRRAH